MTALSLSILSLALSAQPVPPPASTPTKTRMGTGWGVGASAGTTSGLGLSARRHFANRWGLHFGGMYLYTSEAHWANLAAQGLYTFRRSRKTRLYALFGAQFMLSQDDSPPSISGRKPKPSTTLLTGPGLGVEIHFTRNFGWSIEVPATLVVALDGDRGRLPFGGVVNFIPAANTALTFYFR